MKDAFCNLLLSVSMPKRMRPKAYILPYVPYYQCYCHIMAARKTKLIRQRASVPVVNEDEGYTWVLKLAKFNKKECRKVYKDLVENVFVEPAFHQDYRRAVEEYMRWSKARTYRVVLRDHLLGNGQTDWGHEAAIQRVSAIAEELRHHAVKLRKKALASLESSPDAPPSEDERAAGDPINPIQTTALRKADITVDAVDTILAEAVRENHEDLKRWYMTFWEGQQTCGVRDLPALINAVNRVIATEPDYFPQLIHLAQTRCEERRKKWFVKCVPLGDLCKEASVGRAAVRQICDEGVGALINHACCAVALWTTFHHRESIDRALAKRIREKLLPEPVQTVEDLMRLRVPAPFKASDCPTMDPQSVGFVTGCYIGVLAEARELCRGSLRCVRDVRHLLDPVAVSSPFVFNGLAAQVTLRKRHLLDGGPDSAPKVNIARGSDGNPLVTKALSAFYAVIVRRFGKHKVRDAAEFLLTFSSAVTWSMIRAGTFLFDGSDELHKLNHEINEGSLWMVMTGFLTAAERDRCATFPLSQGGESDDPLLLIPRILATADSL